ncbi:hypothetical protein BRADI_4g24840v3 [Brachypodium distachyon]|uniref:Protein kinase domain-containing protein n=2 Tax=Brachypodium distachyon TaxID=15368 RepID=A0A0Q3ESQ8_BRADI|nr:hypothetical protein BRADI_4g24840v3 [Brachypodium distachyon]
MAEAVGSTGGGSGSEDSVGDGGAARATPLAICSDVFERLVAGGHAEEASRSDSLLALQAHFAQLPISYHLYVDAGKAEYVLIHQKVLAEAKADRSRPAVHAHYLRFEELYVDTATTSGAREQGGDAGDALPTRIWRSRTQIHEIVFSSIDRPRLLIKLSTLLSENGLNIREAHVFSTKDGYSIDVFVVDGWPVEDTVGLLTVLEDSISRNMVSWFGLESLSVQPFSAGDCESDIDITLLSIIKKLASGSCGHTFLGTYGGEEVSVKVLRSADATQILWKEFKQEILMLREVYHANIIRSIGSCIKPPHFYIITEYMSGGSLFDFLHNKHNVLDLPMILKFALDICRGMAYLHQKGIIHRDLKSANLLMDKDHVVKVADFGLSRYQDREGVMTAETGTYRWMAPEVMKHQQYGPAADVYSFAIVLWELMTSKMPYDTINPIQAAFNVWQGMRPQIPKNAHPRLLTLMQRCWDASPSKCPPFSDAIAELEDIKAEVQGATSGQTSQGEKRPSKTRKLDPSDPTV